MFVTVGLIDLVRALRPQAAHPMDVHLNPAHGREEADNGLADQGRGVEDAAAVGDARESRLGTLPAAPGRLP